MKNQNSLNERMEQTKQKAAAAAERRFKRNQQERQRRVAEKAQRLADELAAAGIGTESATVGA